VLFAATLTLSAFLLFAVEPMIAKIFLPVLGGAPMVWNTCVVFFQTVLLAGYVYGHRVPAVLGARRHAILYLLLILAPLTVLPFAAHVSSGPSPGQSSVGWLLLKLLTLVGLPFFVLATSTALLQKWYSESDAPGSADPYFLYAASNMGSLLALVAYPSLIEPTMRLGDQSRRWAIGYTLFVVAAFACAAIVWRGRPTNRDDERSAASADETEADAPSLWRRARWVVLSFIPSSLMLACTSYLSTDLAAVPLLWTVPLALYLLTFVIAFGVKGTAALAYSDRLLPLLILSLAFMMIIHATSPLQFLLPLHLITFVTVALLCHAALAHDRPSTASLTSFYSWIALGGMLGGLFNTLVAPAVFSGVFEYPIVLVLACLFRRGRPPAGQSRLSASDIVWPLVAAALTAILLIGIRVGGLQEYLIVVGLIPPVFVCAIRSRWPVTFALSLGAMWLVASWVNAPQRTLHTERTFFGVYRVNVDPSGRFRQLFHGTTLHGRQAIEPMEQNEPLTYYHRTGPFGQAFTQLPHVTGGSEIAVIGLGVGSLASYACADQHWTFFELDPAVERLARTEEYFTYLRTCGPRCRVVLGDARLSLEAEPPSRYSLLVLDAFSSDAIPTHLLTSEAIQLYRSRLIPGGVMAFHISNRHLRLSRVLSRLAERHSLTAMEWYDHLLDKGAPVGKTPSDWIVMAASPGDLGSLASDARWTRLGLSDSTPLWTDDFSSILGVLHF
jgi:hypothetical protein